MGLRDVAGGAARMSAGFWTEVAKAVNPSPRPAPSSTAATEGPPPTVKATDHASPGDAEPISAPDGVLVPLDTWTLMLDQLGHLHESGQELAEARERAARAETQVEFLREQLAEAKAKAKRKPPAPKPAPAPSEPATPTQVIDLRSGRRTRVANARNRVSRWIAGS